MTFKQDLNPFTPSEKRFEDLVDRTRIESHTSQLTNLRLHNLETQIDVWRVKCKSEPNLDNLIGYYGVLDALFSYIASLRAKNDNRQTPFNVELGIVAVKLNRIKEYWEYVTKQVESDNIKKLMLERRKTFWKYVEWDMARLCDEIADSVRRLYQSMNFYFRTVKDHNAIGGVLGDLINIKRKKADKMLGVEKNADSAESEGNGEQVSE